MFKHGQLARTRPATQSKPSLTNLPRDVLAIILGHLQQTSPETIRNVKLVNSQLCVLARYSQLEDVTLILSAGSEAQLVSRLASLKSANLARAVRSVTVQDRLARGQSSESVQGLLKTLCTLIPLMSGLQKISFCSLHIPQEVLWALQKRPDIRLATALSLLAMSESIHTAILYDLQGNINLHALDVKVTYLTASDCRSVMKRLKSLLLSCPNLRCLGLDVSQPSSGCVVYGPSREYCGLGFVGQERPPALHELTLINYPFGHHPSSGPIVNTLGYPGDGREIDHWAQIFDWSRLTRLSTSCDEFAIKLMPHLTSIREVEALQTWRNEEGARFFAKVPKSLTEISVAKVDQLTLDGLMRHAETLHKLHMHQPEAYGLNWASQTIGIDLLHRLQQASPLLEDLCIDIARQGTWPYTILDVLATFPRLRTLELWFELGIESLQGPIKPFVTMDTARHIFHYIRSRCPGGTSRLERLVLHSGAPPQIGFGFPSEDAFWPKYNSTSFVCQLSERDDQAAAGVFSVTCPDLVNGQQIQRRSDRQSSRSPLMEKVLNLVGKPKRKVGRAGTDKEASTGNARYNEAMLVAHEGPRTRSQWRSHY